jgi:hypothetical protein
MKLELVPIPVTDVDRAKVSILRRSVFMLILIRRLKKDFVSFS